MLELEDVTVNYGSRVALDHVSLSIGGGLTFVVGENGAGKTTLMRLVLGAVRAQHGRVTLDGTKLGRRSVSNIHRHIGYLPQQFGGPETMLLHDYVAYAAWLHGVPASRIRAAVDRALGLVGLQDRIRDPFGKLSGGMQRRAGIAQAIVHKPSVLLLDEPAAGLDPVARVELRELLIQLAAHTSVIASTHLLEDVGLSDGRLIALSSGRITYDGRSSDLADAMGSTGPQKNGRSSISPIESAFMLLVSGDTE